jgi:hypothetical protein
MFSTDPPGPTKGFDEVGHVVRFRTGESRLISRDFVFQGKNIRNVVPSLALYVIKGDTSISGVIGQRVDVTFWQFTPDTVLELHWKQLIAYQDSTASIYDLQGGQPAPLFYGLMKAGSMDTSAFLDRDIKILYPLVVGLEWTLRLPDDPLYIEDLRKTYLGIDTLLFDGAKYACGKFAHTFHGGATGQSWISSVGLLQAEVDYGKSESFDDEGNLTDSAHTTESYRLRMVNPGSRDLANAKAEAKKRYSKTITH